MFRNRLTAVVYICIPLLVLTNPLSLHHAFSPTESNQQTRSKSVPGQLFFSVTGLSVKSSQVGAPSPPFACQHFHCLIPTQTYTKKLNESCNSTHKGWTPTTQHSLNSHEFSSRSYTSPKQTLCCPIWNRICYYSTLMALQEQLPPAVYGQLIETTAYSHGECFNAFMDIRNLCFTGPRTTKEIVHGSPIPGFPPSTFVCTHLHGRSTLTTNSVFLRPAKNLASDLRGTTSPFPSRGRGRRGGFQPRGRGRGRSPPLPLPDQIPLTASAAHLCTNINNAVGPISQTSRKIKPDQIIMKAFNNGLPDEDSLHTSGPTTFFLHLNAHVNAEIISMLCNRQSLTFSLHPNHRPLRHSNWVFEDPNSGEYGPVVAENHTVYLTFGIAQALSQAQMEANPAHVTQDAPVLWQCADDGQACDILQNMTTVLQMAAATDISQLQYPFASSCNLCKRVNTAWNFAFTKLVGNTDPAISRMNSFAISAQTLSLTAHNTLLECSPVRIPVVTEEQNMTMAVLSIYISDENPTLPPNPDGTVQSDSELTAAEEVNFRKHALQLRCQTPMHPEDLVHLWQEELLSRITAALNELANLPIPDPPTPQYSMENSLVGLTNIALHEVRTSASVQVRKPYRITARSQESGKVTAVLVSPLEPRVVQFAISTKGSLRFQVTPPSSSDNPQPVSLFISALGLKIFGSSNPITVPLNATPAIRAAAVADIGMIIDEHYTFQPPPSPIPPTPTATHPRPPTYVSLLRPNPTQQPPQVAAPTNNPIFEGGQNPTPTRGDVSMPDTNPVRNRVYYTPNKFNLVSHSKFTSITFYSCRMPTGCRIWSGWYCNYPRLSSSMNAAKPKRLRPHVCSSSSLRQNPSNWNILRISLHNFKRTAQIQKQSRSSLLRQRTQRILPTPTLTLATAPRGTELIFNGKRRTFTRTQTMPTRMATIMRPMRTGKTKKPKTTPSYESVPLVRTSNLPQFPNHISVTQLSLKTPIQFCYCFPIKTLNRSTAFNLTQSTTLKSLVCLAPLVFWDKPPKGQPHEKLIPESTHLRRCPTFKNNQQSLADFQTLVNITEKTTPCPETPYYDINLMLLCNDVIFGPLEVTRSKCRHQSLALNIRTHYTLTHPSSLSVNTSENHLASLSHIKMNIQKSATQQEWTWGERSRTILQSMVSLPFPTPSQHKHMPVKLNPYLLTSSIKNMAKIITFNLWILLKPISLNQLSSLVVPTLHITRQVPSGLNASLLIKKASNFFTEIIHLSLLWLLTRLIQTLILHNKCKPRRYTNPSPSYPIKTWLNTLPDRFGSTVLQPPTAPWLNRRKLAPQWRPKPTNPHGSHSPFFIVNKRQWIKYVRASNKNHLISIIHLISPVYPVLDLFNAVSLNGSRRLFQGSTIMFILLTVHQIGASLSEQWDSFTPLVSNIVNLRSIILILLLRSGDIHPNPGPPLYNLSENLRIAYNTLSQDELSNWIGNQNPRDISFSINGTPFNRNDMLSGFHKRYMDKSDQSTLLQSFVKYIQHNCPHIPAQSVRIVNTGEENDMERKQIPHNWTHHMSMRGRSGDRGRLMSDPLNGLALVIPKCQHAHFTTYIIHQQGVYFYDSLHTRPDSTLINKYYRSLTQFYDTHPTLKSPLVMRTLHNMTNSPPIIMPCTKQIESPKWSCGYCSANVCIQAVIQQQLPTINQPLNTIYTLQKAWLDFRITGVEPNWPVIIQQLSLAPLHSNNTPDTTMNTHTECNSPPNTNPAWIAAPEPTTLPSQVKSTRPSFPTNQEPKIIPPLCRETTLTDTSITKNPRSPNTTKANRGLKNRQKPISHWFMVNSEDTTDAPTPHPPLSSNPSRETLHKNTETVSQYPHSKNMQPPSPYPTDPLEPSGHPSPLKTVAADESCPVSKPYYSPTQTPNCNIFYPADLTQPSPSLPIKEKETTENTSETHNTKQYSHYTQPLTQAEKTALTSAKRNATRRKNKNKKNNQNPITSYLSHGAPQSRAIKKPSKKLRLPKVTPANLFTKGCYSTIVPQIEKSPTRMLPRQYYTQPTPTEDNEFNTTTTTHPVNTPPDSPPPNNNTPHMSPPTQEEPIEQILSTHHTQQAYTPKAAPSPQEKKADPFHMPDYNALNETKLSICTLNLCKGGENSPSRTDLQKLIEDHNPDILILTETPYENKARTLKKFLRRHGFELIYTPPPAPPRNQDYLPKEARLPQAILKSSSGGALCAYKKDAPWAHFVSPVKLKDPTLDQYIAAILIHSPETTNRLIASIYIPHRNPEMKKQIWDKLTTLGDDPMTPLVCIGGDFQENIHLKSSTAYKHSLYPMKYDNTPTFCPPHAPLTATIIDGFLTKKEDDPWAHPSNYNISCQHTAYTDHHALLLQIHNAKLPHVSPVQPTLPSKPPQLKLPLSKTHISRWHTEVRQQFSQQLHEIINTAKSMLNTHPAHSDPMWKSQIYVEITQTLTETLTDILATSANTANQIMPLISSPPPPIKNKQRPHWPSQKKTQISDAAHRSKLLRQFNNARARPNGQPYSLTNLTDDLAQLPIIEEYSKDLDLELPTEGSTPTQESICNLYKAHKTYAKRLKRAANKEATSHYSEFLEKLYKHKPKKALDTILKAYKDGNNKHMLTIVKDFETGTLHTAPEECVEAITREQKHNLSATVPNDPILPYPWSEPNSPDPFELCPDSPLPTEILHTLTRADYDLSISNCSSNKATGPDAIPSEIIKNMPPEFHEALYNIFLLLTRTKKTPVSWLQSRTALLYKKGDPSLLDNYRPIALTNHLYKIWSSTITRILTDFVETHNILQDAQEGFRQGKGTSRAVAHLQLLIEDAHKSNQPLYITYIDFKGAYPSVDHYQLQQVMRDLGIPQDLCELIRGLHQGANTSFLSPHGETAPIPINRGTPQGDPLSPILFDLMLEPLNRWLQKGTNSYIPKATGLPQEGILYADDVTLTTHSSAAMQKQLDKIELFGHWSHIKVSPSKSRTTAWIPDIQHLKQADRDMNLKDALAHLKINNTRIPAITQDEALPGGYLGCQLTPSLTQSPQKLWLSEILREAKGAINMAPVSIQTKVSMLHYLTYSKIRHTMGQMLYDYEFIQRMDSILADTTKKAWKLPKYLPTAAAQGATNDLGLDSPSLALDYGANAATLLPEILSDTGRLGALARASLSNYATQRQHWPKEIALDKGIGFLCKAQYLLQEAGILINGFPKAWQGNPLCTSLIEHIKAAVQQIPIDTSPNFTPPYPDLRKICRHLKPLWANGITSTHQVLTPGPTPTSPPVVLSFREFQYLYPDIIQKPGTAAALRYLTDLLMSNSPEEFSDHRSRKPTALQPQRLVAQRWLEGPAPIPIPTQPPKAITPPKQTNNNTQAKPRYSQQDNSTTSRTKTTKRKKLNAHTICDQPIRPHIDPPTTSSSIHKITAERKIPAEELGLETDPNILIQQYQTHWNSEILPYKDMLIKQERGMIAEWVKPLHPGHLQPEVPICLTCKQHVPYQTQRLPIIHCSSCNNVVHTACHTQPGLNEQENTSTPWQCKPCQRHNQYSCPAPNQPVQVQWAPSWMGARHILGPPQQIQGAQEAMTKYRLQRASHKPVPKHPHMQKQTLQSDPKIINLPAKALPQTERPQRLHLSSNISISTEAIDPDRDALPIPGTPKYRAFLVKQTAEEEPMVRICDPHGRSVSPKDLTRRRYNFLATQHKIHCPEGDLNQDIAALLRRYHPKANTQNPQGRALDLNNHWALPIQLMTHFRTWTKGPVTELFASPLNCHPDPNGTYYSAFPEDKIFGARHDGFSTSWRGHCIGNPEYEHDDMLDAVEQAIASAEASPQPFTCILTLPRWKDTPYRKQSILQHRRLKIVTGIPSHKFKFIPANKEMSQPQPLDSGAAKWAIDIILVSNEKGYQSINWPEVQLELPKILRALANSPDLHVNFFPHPASLPCLTRAPHQPAHCKNKNKRSNIRPRAMSTPTPAPLDPPVVIESHTWPQQPDLSKLPHFSIHKSTPLTVIELCGGIGTGLEALLRAGHTIGSYTWADINPDGHTVMQDTITKLQQEYGDRFPASASEGWDSRLPFDINMITHTMLQEAFPQGAHVVIAGPPCQPYSVAGKGKGLKDGRSSALLSVARIITHLSKHNSQGVGYIVENVPGVRNYPEVLATLGKPLKADAPPCGSVAKRETLFWTNMAETETLQDKFNLLLQNSPPSLYKFLQKHGFHDWTIPSLVGHNRAPPNDKYNRIGAPLAILPKFVCYPNQRAYRLKGGYGRLRHKGILTVPTVHMKELAMGFHRNRTQAGGLSDQHRHYLLGQCIDVNLLTWLLEECSSKEGTREPNPRPHSSTPPSHPLAGPKWAAPSPASTDSIDAHLDTTLPTWTPAHDSGSFVYTDGSKKDDAPFLGAAVYHAPSNTTTYINATGMAECNTVVRAELVAIYEAMERYNDQHIHILTDSLTAIQKILLLHSQPMRSTRDHHARILNLIANQLQHRSQTNLTTAISKVAAHMNIKGNEIADKAAKAVVDALRKQEQQDTPCPPWVEDTTAPGTPHRRLHYLTDDPPVREEGKEPHRKVLVTKKEITKRIKPHLRYMTAPPSQYKDLLQAARTHEEEPIDLDNTAKYIAALIRKGARHQAKRLLAFIWGVMYTQKQAYRFGHSPDQLCPVCKTDTDSCTHVGSGCQDPEVRGLHIDRHNAAVRVIRQHISRSPVGASCITGNLTLVSEDTGTKSLPEDILTEEEWETFQETFLASFTTEYEQQAVSLTAPRDHIQEDLTQEITAYEAALGSWLADTNHLTKRQDRPSLSDNIPEWVLPRQARNQLLNQRAGIKPDLVFVRGAPSPRPGRVTEANKRDWQVVIIEVGFCADLRLASKRKDKTEKYQPLLRELRKTWKQVKLVVIPIGNAGALLQSSKKELATLISTQPAKQLETQRAERLARSLTTVAARRLHGITQRYYQRRREAAADQRGEKTPHQRSRLAGQKRAP